MAQECAFDEGADGVLFVFVELVDGFEVEGEVGIGASVVVGEDERIGADGEGDCESSDDVEGGLGVAGFVASYLGDVDFDGLGERGLGELAFFAELGEAFGEVHSEGECDHGRSPVLKGLPVSSV